MHRLEAPHPSKDLLLRQALDWSLGALDFGVLPAIP